MNDERQENDMFQNRNKSQEKQKKPRVLSIGTRRPVVIALWALLICAFAFAVYKDFTAVDTHTVHETTVVQEEVTDTNAIESFVTNFAKVYYSWEQSAASIEQRTENLKYYLTDELLTLNVDTVRSDVPVSSKVEDVQIWSVEEIGDKVYKIVYSVSQNVINGEESSVITSVYEVSVYVDDAGEYGHHPRALQSRASPKSPATFLKLPSRTVTVIRRKETYGDRQSFLTTFSRCTQRRRNRSFLIMSAVVRCR